MRYHGDHHVFTTFCPLKVCTLHTRKISLKKIPKCKIFFLSPNSKLNQQKQWYVVSQRAAKIYPSSKYEYFPVILLLTNHETLFNINIVPSFHTRFEPISTLFTFTGLWPLGRRIILTLSLVPKDISFYYSGVNDLHTLPRIYLSLSNSRWKRIENARKTHYFSNANFENPIKAHYRYALNCSAAQLPVNQSISQV